MIRTTYSIALPFFTFALCFLLMPSFARGFQDGLNREQNSGTISRVTLFRDRALVTREIKVKGSNNEREIQVGQLPDNVVMDSVFAEGLGKAEVRSVRVGRRIQGDTNNKEVQTLTVELDLLGNQLNELRQKQAANRKQSEYIEKLMNFSAVSTSSDLARGVLNAESLTQISKFALENQSQIADAALKLTQQIQDLEKKLLDTQQQISQFTDSSKPIHEAHIIVKSIQDGVIELSYLVSGCSWSPSYNVYGTVGSDQFQIRFSALIQQMSGEGWNNVRLTLSTASPSVNSAGPSLTPLRIGIVSRGSGLQAGQKRSPSMEQILNGASLVEKQQDVAQKYLDGYREKQSLSRDLALNEVANDYQSYELQADSAQLKTLAGDVGADVSSQSYELSTPLQLASRREQHYVAISETKMKGEMYHVATPLLSSFAYREAELKNGRAEGLLAGPVSVYLDGKFVGRTELASVASGQIFVVGFGADQQVRTRRELLSKWDEVLGGNRRFTFKYRLVVANFKQTPIKLRLVDRLPLAGQGAEVQIEYDAASPKLSADALYNRIQRPRGILRWDVEVAAEKFGAKAYDVEYSYTLSFDRTLQLATNSAKAQVQQDMFESAPAGSAGGMGGMGGGMGGMGGMGGNGSRRN